MAKVIIDIPKEKMQSFLLAISPLGIDSRLITNWPGSIRVNDPRPSASHLKRISSSFILFDWEFFVNELEYE